MFDVTMPASPRVLGGDGALAALPARLQTLGRQRVVVVANRALEGGDLLGDLVSGLGPMAVGVYAGVRSHAPTDDVDAILSLAQEMRADTLISLGTNSVTDACKAVIWSLSEKSAPKQVAVPTMFGGSEGTSMAGILDGSVKRALTADRLLPDLVVLDPAAPAHLPRSLTGPSIANALAHCAEGLISRDVSPLSDAYYLHALRLLADGIRGFLSDPGPAPFASLQAGGLLAAIPRVRMGVAHAIVHDISPNLGISHAQAHGVVMLVAMRYSAPAVAAKQRLMGHAMGLDLDDLEDEAAAAATWEWLAAVLADLGVASGLRELGADPAALGDAAARLAADGLPWNPRPLADQNELLALLEQAWAGTAASEGSA